MIDELQCRMLKALGHKGAGFEELRRRARTVLGLSGDLRLEAFVARLAEFDSRQEDVEAIAGLVIHKPARDWSDVDPARAVLELAELALRFRQAEVLAGVQGREPTQHAVAVVFGTGEAGRTVMKSFHVPETDRVEVGELADQVLATLKRSGLDSELLLAALAEAVGLIGIALACIAKITAPAKAVISAAQSKPARDRWLPPAPVWRDRPQPPPGG
jgi:hypothetical protein